MKEIIKIAIAEDHDLLRDGLVSILKSEPQFEVVFQAKNGLEVIEALPNKQPHVLLLDLDMPYMSGIEILNFLESDFPNVRAIMLSMHNSKNFILQCLVLGARSFLAKNTDVEHMIAAIESTYRYGFYINDDHSMRFLESELSRVDNYNDFSTPEPWMFEVFQRPTLAQVQEEYNISDAQFQAFWVEFQKRLRSGRFSH